MLATRIATATVLLAVFLTGLFLSKTIFFALVLIALALAALEWSSLMGIRKLYSKVMYIAMVVLIVLMVVSLHEYLASFVFGFAVVAVAFWILLVPMLAKYPATERLFQNKVCAGAISMMILIPAACGLLWLRAQEFGAWVVFCLVSIVIIADSGAYFAGKKYGKTLLAPDISPGKTFEGFYGGLCLNFIFAILLSLTLGFSPEKTFTMVLIVIATSLFSVAGDLLESAVKRSHGVKDSGTILPGHGGVLDRIDGLCAATPCFVFGVLLSGI